MPAWEVFNKAAEQLSQSKIDFALCGGIAVQVYGRTRETTDIDFLVRETDVEDALIALEKAGFEISRTDPKWLFQGFKNGVKVDLIFEAMGGIQLTPEVRAHTKEIELGGYIYRVISPEDLIIMKAHSLNEERAKDLFDALSIIKGIEGGLDWNYFIERSRTRLKRMLALLFFAQSDQQTATHVPDWVIHSLIAYLPSLPSSGH
ncbi:MAG: nucleotidyl transferase AbiEii/AbiGii toxin family protein [Actinomycetota bacterium]|nr:nucleotidyl transferase AbiEii/AbiGii toxin family protein [Actinomycetota bacterium]